MSSMLEQAIVDAKTLREAAMKSAESAVIEKYSHEVKEAITQLLEQDDIDPDDIDPDEENSADNETTMEQVPMAHFGDDENDAGEDEVVVVDLDDIIAAANAEPDEEEFELDRSEIADEIGIDLDADEGELPANRSDEIDLDENDLVNMFKEMLVVDVPEIEIERAEERVNKDEVEEDEKVETIRTDGMDEDDIEEYERTMAKNESLSKENKKFKSLLGQVKNKLQEITLQNARLLYANRVLTDTSLNEQQKNQIAEMVGKAQSVDEAKMVFKTLQKALVSTSKRSGPQSLSEAVTRKSSVIITGNRKEDSSTESNPTISRWAMLAGLDKKTIKEII